MTLEQQIQRIQASLTEPLPGHAAHLRMARRPRPGWVPRVLPPGCRDGAVLLLIYPRGGTPHIVLTVRSDTLPHHGGQVSLPGGGIARGETAGEAALREAREEIGLDSRNVRLLGDLTPFHVVASQYIVHPVVATVRVQPDFRIASAEVERILEVPVAELLEPSRVHVEVRMLEGLESEIPYFGVAGQKVWGATAMILSEFVALLGNVPDPWGARSRRAP